MISIIIATHNRPEKLDILLGTIVKNVENKDFEIVIVDDCSSETHQNGYKNVINKREYETLSLVYKYNSKKVNAAYTRNCGAGIAKGDLYYFIDDDCEFNKNNLKIIENFYSDKNNLNSTLTGPLDSPDNFYCLLDNRCLNTFSILFTSLKYSFLYKLFFWKKINSFPAKFVPAGNLAVPAAIFNELKFDDTYTIAEDNDFSTRLIEAGYRCTYQLNFSIVHHHNFKSLEDVLKRRFVFDQYKAKKNILVRKFIAIVYPIIITIFNGDFRNYLHYYKIYNIYNPDKNLNVKLFGLNANKVK